MVEVVHDVSSTAPMPAAACRSEGERPRRVLLKVMAEQAGDGGIAGPGGTIAMREGVHDAQRAAAGGCLGGRPVHGILGRAGPADPDDGTRLPAAGHRPATGLVWTTPFIGVGRLSTVGSTGAVAVPAASGGVARSRKRSSSTGKGRTRVEFFSAATSTTVWSRRSCRAAGVRS
jgi:hypothetical protein